MNCSESYDPFDLPYESFIARCRAEREVFLPANAQGATPGTSLYGSFGEHLLRTVCTARPQCRDKPGSACTPQCPAHWLFKPYLTTLRRNAARPIFLYSPELDTRTPVSAFDLHVTLWGRHALRYRSLVEQTLIEMGRSGLALEGVKQPFQILRFDDVCRRTLADVRRALSERPIDRLLVCFETPLRYREKNRGSDGACQSLWMAGGQAPMPELAGNAAFELAAWDLTDRALDSWDHDRQTACCRWARAAATEAMAGVAPLASLLQPVRLGKRFSSSSGHDYPVDGFTGFVELGGDLAPALPWLAVLSLQGGGQNRAMGFGRIRLWAGAPLI